MSEFALVSDNDYLNIRGAADSAARVLESLKAHPMDSAYREQCALKLMYYAGQLSYMRQVLSVGATVDQQARLSDAIHKLVLFCSQAETIEATKLALDRAISM